MLVKKKLITVGSAFFLFLAACGPAEVSSLPSPTLSAEETPEQTVVVEPTLAPKQEYNIVTLLPRDAIPAIDDPVYLSVDEANLVYEEDELVIGVEFEGEARAYSIPLLSSHEIVNDTVGGRKIAVTW